MDAQVLQCIKSFLSDEAKKTTNAVSWAWLDASRTNMIHMNLGLQPAGVKIFDSIAVTGAAAFAGPTDSDAAAGCSGLLLSRDACAAVKVSLNNDNPYLARWWTSLDYHQQASAQVALQRILSAGIPMNCRELSCDEATAKLCCASGDSPLLEAILQPILFLNAQLGSEAFFAGKLEVLKLPQRAQGLLHRPSPNSVQAGEALSKALLAANLHCLHELVLPGWCLASTPAAATAFAQCLSCCASLRTVELGQRHAAEWEMTNGDGGEACSQRINGWAVVLRQLLCCPQLTRLTLHFLTLGDSSPEMHTLASSAAAASSKLSHISLQACNIRSPSLPQGAPGCLFSALASWPCELQDLHLKDCSANVASWSASADCLYAHCESLRTVKVESCNVGASGWLAGVAEGLRACRGLQQLRLKRARLDSSCTQSICGVLRAVNNLRDIDFSGNELFGRSEFEASSFAAALGEARSLATVRLQHVGLAGPSWTAFVETCTRAMERKTHPGFLCLDTLNIANNAVGAGTGAGQLAAALYALQVKRTELCAMGPPKGGPWVRQHMPIEALQHLSVGACGLSSLGLGKVLLALLHSGTAAHLKSIDLAHNPALRALHDNLLNPHLAVSEVQRAAGVAEDNAELAEWAASNSLRLTANVGGVGGGRGGGAAAGNAQHAAGAGDGQAVALCASWIALLAACVAQAAQLQVLSLEGLHMGDAGLELLASRMGAAGTLDTLHTVELGENLLSGASAAVLCKLVAAHPQQGGALRKLGLAGNAAMSSLDVEALRRVVPLCHVAFM